MLLWGNIRVLKNFTKVTKRFISTNKWIKYRMDNEPLPSHRVDPLIKTIDTPEFKSILSTEVQFLISLFKKYNYELRVAGGAVRDILMGINPKDLDFATTATPQQMKEMFQKEEIRTINVNGEKHGTVTSRINDKINFEITTLRIDVVTNGRHADVAFTTNWLLDAGRRDLTINSMFLDFNGNVYDYFYGYDDLMNKRVAFVGDPAKRICEDFLRILRYFRFYGRISDNADKHDTETINAIKKNVQGLEIISGERIWSEWSKILEGNFCRELTKKMIECGCAKYIGLPENPNINKFDEICLRAQKNNLKLRPVTLVTALLSTPDEVLAFYMRLKFSAFERNLSAFIMHNQNILPSEKPLKTYQKMVLHTINKPSDAREYVCELLKYQGYVELLKEFEKWDVKFPLGGRDVVDQVTHNRMIGLVLDRLKDIWLDHDCEMPEDKLRSYIPEVVAEVNEAFSQRVEDSKPSKKKKKLSG